MSLDYKSTLERGRSRSERRDTYYMVFSDKLKKTGEKMPKTMRFLCIIC